MAQGHGLSILVRAFLTTKEEKYLTAAGKALQIYKNMSADHGVRARFLNLYDW